MDEFYVMLISYWIWEAISMVFGFSVKIFFCKMPWFMAVIIGYEFFFVFLFCYLHTLLSLLCNFILIYKPHIVYESRTQKLFRSQSKYLKSFFIFKIINLCSYLLIYCRFME